MINTQQESALDALKSTIRIKLLDPHGRGIEGLKYQILDGGKVVATGRTDATGGVRPFGSEIGRLLSVYVERFASGEMKKIKTLIPWSVDFSIKLLSGKVKETVRATSANGDSGSYKRKTYIVRPRDTLGKIAHEQRTSVEALAHLNGIDPEKIRVGQVIKLPVEPQGLSDGAGGGAPSRSGKATKQSAPVAAPTKVDDRGANGTPKTSVDVKCDQSGCIKVGMTGPLVKEINIRLMGFGGSIRSNASLDQFTTDTEAAVKQFQRDYMNAAETGKVCGAVLRALDDFRLRFPVSIDSMKCPCNHCDGFGGQRTESSSVQYFKDGKSVRGVEYPGMHRALLWLFRAALFYVADKDKASGYAFLAVASGYRCWFNNKTHGRTTTNHMGNALDLQFKHGNSNVRCTGQNLERLREKIFMNRLGAQMRWGNANQAALEATSDGATSWVHVDVRRYGNAFKQDEYYAVTQGGADGDPLVEMARRADMLVLVNCGGVPPRTPAQRTDRMPIGTVQLSDKGLEFIKGWEKFRSKPYDDSKGYCTVGYGHLLDYTSCENLKKDPGSEYHTFKDGVTEQRGTEILRSDVEKAVDEVRKYIHVPVYQQEFDALVSLAFNAGSFRKFPNLVSKINTTDYSGGCNEFADITNGGTSGLVKRRQAEMKMFRNNIYDSSH